MVEYLEQLFVCVRPAFARPATYVWFVTVCMGIILRTDDYGVSSFVRALGLAPANYLLLLHFFHSQAWCVTGLMERWWVWVVRQNVAWRLQGRLVLTGDHTKTPKDGRRMPAVTTLHQDSETASKPSFFRGHHWGCLALVTHAAERWFATPLWVAVHEGLEQLGGPAAAQEPKTVRLVTMAQQVAQVMGQTVYLVLDAYFAVGPVFTTAAAVCDDGVPRVQILTRAKKNIVAYLPAHPKPAITRGRPPRYGRKLKLYDLFAPQAAPFQCVTTPVYGHTENVRYYVLDLLWKPAHGYIRFLWFETRRGRLLLMSSDLTLQPLEALAAYCHRATIETLFDTLKNVLAGMTYHFWSKYLARASRRPRHNDRTPEPTTQLHAPRQTLAAIEKYVNLHLLVLGALQMLALHFPSRVRQSADCWMRTTPRTIPSEFIVKTALAALWRSNKCAFAKSFIASLIRPKQKSLQAPFDSSQLLPYD